MSAVLKKMQAKIVLTNENFNKVNQKLSGKPHQGNESLEGISSLNNKGEELEHSDKSNKVKQQQYQMNILMREEEISMGFHPNTKNCRRLFDY